MTEKTLVLREATEALKRAHALLFFEEKHRSFLERVPPIYVSTSRPVVTWTGAQAQAVSEYFGNADWTPEDYGIRRYKVVDLVEVAVTDLPELESERTKIPLISPSLPHLDCVGGDGCKIGLQNFPSGSASLN